MHTSMITAGSAAVLALATITGCSHPSVPPAPTVTHPSPTGGATTKTAAAKDYSHILLTPDAMGDEDYTAQPPTLNPDGIPGASKVLLNQAGTRAVGATVFVLATPDAAVASLNGARRALGTVIDDADPQPAPVGANGVLAAGQSPHGAKAVTVVMFTEGRTFTTVKFDAAPADAVPAALATDVAQRQDARIKATPV